MRTSMPTCMLVTILAAICTVRSMVSHDIVQILANADRDRQLDEYGQYIPDDPPSLDDMREFNANLKALNNLANPDNALPGDDKGDNALFDANLAPDRTGAVVRKRPFCNGFTGCGRIGYGKRSASDPEPLLLSNLRQSRQSPAQPEQINLAKRPFCNGFFGCGNHGKRIVYRPRVGYRSRGRYVGKNQKRVFCNPGAFGCYNQGKRGSMDSQWVDSIRKRLLSGFANND